MLFQDKKKDFVVGDTFSVGSLVVTATKSDGTTADVTADAVVSQSADMSTAGTYEVTVSYDGCSVKYNITVVGNVATLKAIKVLDAQTQFSVGDEFTLGANAKVKETYDNTLTDDTEETKTDLSGYTVKVYDSNEKEVTSLNVAGTYSVVVSKGELSDTYDITVAVKAYATVAAAVEVAVANGSNIVSGEVTVDNIGYSNVSKYVFGVDYTMVEQYETKNHYQMLADETIFAVSEQSDGSLSVPYSYGPENMVGVDLGVVFSYQYDIYGVESLLNNAYKIATAATSNNFVEEVKDSAYTFSFDAMFGSYYYFVKVSFTIGDYNAIATLNVDIDGYYDSSVTLDEETGKYSVNADVTTPDFTRVVTVAQVAGEKTAVMPYKAEEICFNSFDLTAEDGTALPEKLSFDVAEQISVLVSNVSPSTADANFDEFEVTVTTSTGEQTYSMYGRYSEGCIVISGYKAGDYIVTVSTQLVTKTFNVTVNPAVLSEFASGLLNDYAEVEEASNATVYVGVDLTLGVVVNSYASTAFTAELVEATDNATVTPSGNFYVFNATVPGTYEVKLISSEDSNFTDVITIVVEEAPSLADILKGKYQYDDWGNSINYVFTPASEGALNGTCEVSYSNWFGDFEGAFTYTYYEALSYLEVLPVDEYQDCEFSFTLVGYDLYAYDGYYELGKLEKVEESDSGDDSLVEGKYTSSFTHPMLGQTYSYEIVFNANGTGSYNLHSDAYIGTFTYVVENNIILVSNVVDAADGAPVEFEIEINADGIYVVAQENTTGLNSMLQYVSASSGDDDSDAGTYLHSEKHPMSGMEIGSTITLGVDGTGTYDLYGNWYYGAFNYEVVDGVVTFSNVTPMFETDDVILSATLADGVLTLTYTVVDGDSTTIDCAKQ